MSRGQADAMSKEQAARRIQSLHRWRVTVDNLNVKEKASTSAWRHFNPNRFAHLSIAAQRQASQEELEAARSGKIGKGLTHFKKLGTLISATAAFRADAKYKMHSKSQRTTSLS